MTKNKSDIYDMYVDLEIDYCVEGGLVWVETA